MLWRHFGRLLCTIVSPATSLTCMKDQVQSFGSEVSRWIKYKGHPKIMLALALRGHSSHLTLVKSVAGT